MSTKVCDKCGKEHEIDKNCESCNCMDCRKKDKIEWLKSVGWDYK
jgi:hypothetical protein